MPRTKLTAWDYSCDTLNCYGAIGGRAASLRIRRGDACNTARGSQVHDQADADAHARTLGWQLTHGGRQVFCPACTGRGR